MAKKQLNPRPGHQTRALEDEICLRISEGQTLRSICRDAHMPAFGSVYRWQETDKDFRARFARAREIGFDAIADEAIDIANTPFLGDEVTDDGIKVSTKRGDMVQHRKLQVETRLKLLAKWSPDRYGDKRTIDMTVTDSVAERLARARARVGANDA